MPLFEKKKSKIGDKKKYLLFSQLYSLLTAGLSFSRSFELLIKQEEKSKEAEALRQTYGQILDGREFWRALEASGAFTNLDTGVVRIGEETGKLDQSLQFLSDYYRKRNEQRNMVVGSLSYPLVIVITAVLVLFFMLTVVIPMFEQVYSRMGGELPAMTRFMIRLSERFPTLCVVFAVVGIALVGVKLWWGNTEAYRRFTARLLLRVPFVGSLLRSHYQAQFCKLLYLLVSSDVPLLQSFEMLRGIIRFYPYERSFHVIIDGLTHGDSLSDNMDKFRDIYGGKLTALVRVGEETNCLPRMFANLSDDITQELEHRLKRLGSVLEPVLIIAIGGIVAFVLISMYLPMFQLGQIIN
ncbi:MAG: type II secretion system F family protein [Mediterranea sp.]|jgi:type IV pilus assembly protein PilC|nr:type II secretion system F family protein [Mediterranea sp.]